MILFGISLKRDKEMHKVSVITWDLQFRDTLHSIPSLADVLKSFDVEFIVVGQTKPEVKVLFSVGHDVKFIEKSQEIYHPGILLNEGIANATGDYLLICDGDLVFPDLLDKFLMFCVRKQKVGLTSRLNLKKLAERDFRETLSWNECEKHSDDFFLNQKLNNFAPLIFVRKSDMNAIGNYSEENLFATMNSRFGMHVVKRLEKLNNQKALVCPFPVFHQWHPTPRVKISRSSQIMISINLLLQGFYIYVDCRSSTRLFRRVILLCSYPFIKINLKKWSKP